LASFRCFFYVGTFFLCSWAMSFNVLGVSVFIETFIPLLILVVCLVLFMRGGKKLGMVF
ncbi:hypothetical protein BAE44_0012718, partial [Dichanthelium oligosanthes]